MVVIAALAATLPVLALGGRAAASTVPVTWGPTGIHVVHPSHGSPYLADANGGEVLLRGVDANALVQYSDQPGCSYQETVPLTTADFSEMAALGMDFLRLAVSWSRIEPAPGVFSEAYLAQIRSVIAEAGHHGIAVLVDMHQDRYNRHLWCGQEVDGAPDWATVTDGTPCVDIELSTSCAQVATQAFWSNDRVDGHPLQQWYLGALRAVARDVGSAPNLAGIELMNEPTPGLVGPGAFELTELYPFYRAMIGGLRAAGYRSPIWFEPSVLRDETDDARYGAIRFSSDPQLVYAVHIYTGVFSYPQGPDNSQLQLEQSYQSAAAEAAAFGTPWVDDEFGADASSAWDTWISRQLSLQNRYTVGSGFWLWQQQPGFYGWSVVHRDGTLRSSTDRAQLLSLPHVDTAPGRLLAMTLLGPSSDGALPHAPTALRATVDSAHGGTATFWSGTVVRSGGPSLIHTVFDNVTVNGRTQTATCHQLTFQAHSSAVADTPASPEPTGARRGTRGASTTVLSGCDVTVHLPPGTSTVVLTPHP